MSNQAMQAINDAINCAYDTAERLLHREPYDGDDTYRSGALYLTINRGNAAGLVGQAITKIRAAERFLATEMADTMDAMRLQLAATALHTAVAAFRAADSSH